MKTLILTLDIMAKFYTATAIEIMHAVLRVTLTSYFEIILLL